jgi:hypothetical protein
MFLKPLDVALNALILALKDLLRSCFAVCERICVPVDEEVKDI